MTKTLLWAGLLAASWCEAQDLSPTPSRKPTDSLPPRFFTLGTVEVISKKQSDLNGFLSSNRLQMFAQNDVSKALNLLTGYICLLRVRVMKPWCMCGVSICGRFLIGRRYSGLHSLRRLC